MNLDDFKNLAVWRQLVATADPNHIALVERHVTYILPLMEKYVDTFPTYTLHNKEHLFNVIRIMGSILGDRVDQLSGLECAILVLTAVYHDFGMVFTEEERERISQEQDFQRQFLNVFPSARVKYEEGGKIVTKEIAEWYCRWRHAPRVWKKFEEVEANCGGLEWHGMAIREAVGHVCESHNEPSENIRIYDERFTPNFLGDCDLRFCALLLRLADIMDFDNSRSPQSVYDFLDLGNPKNTAERISRDEWNKHMASRGFQFPGTPTTSPVLFMAAPPHPYIEQGIRDFIDLIDLELGASEKVSKLCSEKWLHFPFPVEVDRSAIQSINYLSGKYRFFLSEDKILTLLTGDDLYSDDFVFVRELLQNAIDTVRHRAFIEGIKNPKFVPLPISVSFFKDAEGYHWLRMDDEGMGMSQEIIQSYLLNKGNSYYNSDLFKLERIKIREANGRDFVPISRFGIGLLSCFMTCDKIEINTCYFYENDDRSLAKNRLSIEGRGGFWVIRNDKMHHLADRMPSEKGWEKGYRDVPGTSIACRIKTARDFRGINIKDQINRYLLAPEIPVSFQGEYLGGDINELVKTPWCTSSVTTLPQEFISKCSELLNCAVENIDIDIRSISLTQKSATQNLRGQMVVVVPRIKVGNVNKYFNTGDYFRIRSDGNNATLVCEKTEKTENGQELKKEENCDITEILSNIKIPERFSEDTHGHSRFRWPRVSHNGIVVYDNDRQLEVELKQFDQFDELHRHHSFFLSTGLFWFRDELLPEVTVSRNVIKRIPDEIIAHVLFATRELNDFAGTEQLLFAFMPKIERNYNMRFTLETLEKTRLYDDHIAYWNELPCIYLKDRGVSSISVALELAKVGPIIFKTKFFNSRFYLEFTKYMILRNFHISYISNGNDDYHLQAFLAGEKNKISPELLPFQPMRFIECDQKDKIVLLDGFINRIHPLSQWFLTWFPIIEKDFYYLGMQLMNELLGSTVPDQKVGSVNEILVRLRELLPIEARPSEELNISVDSLFSENK